MATTLVVNTGSTSRKYALYKEGRCQATLFFEETGTGFSFSVVRNGEKKSEEEIHVAEFEDSLSRAVSYLIESGDITDKNDIETVGIRVVAPGSYFVVHRIIDATYIHKLKEIASVAPLHIPGLLREIASVEKNFSDTLLIGVSDSAFHTTIPTHVRTVSISHADAQEFDIQRFGYHGLSFSSVAQKLEKQFGAVPKRVIVCHIGGGISVGALKDGASIATSMGYSPASGMLMGSRGGDIEADVLAALTIKKRLKGNRLYEYLYKESGFQGVSGIRDLRLVVERAVSGDADARLALDMFVYQIQSWIASHATLLGGVDAVVMTATASVRNPYVRSIVLSKLSLFGIELDADKNDALIGKEGVIHKEGSSVQVAVMKTSEMDQIEQVSATFKK